MRFRLNRRALLKAAGSAAVGIFAVGSQRFHPPAYAQTGDKPLSVVELRGALKQISGAGGNVVLLDNARSPALVDSGAPGATQALMRVISEHVGERPVDTLFNTHWHLAHTGGNDVVGQSNARIIAHENTRLWMTTQFYVRWEKHTYLPRDPAAHPNDTFFSSDPQPLIADVGGHRVEYGHLENAHTDGDIYVFFTNENVLVAGGAAMAGQYPVPDYPTGGWIDGLIDSTRELLDLADAETIIVPGRGPAQRREFLNRQLQMASALRERIAERMRLGMSADEMMADGITDDFDAAWGGRELGHLFVANSYEDLAWRGPGGSL